MPQRFFEEAVTPSDRGAVSIIMPAFNCEEQIAFSIESVRAQSFADWELLITDDCSTDGTWSIIEDFADFDSRIKPIRLAQNSGAAEARNASLRRASNRFIAFLDSDDLWLPDKLERQIAFMTDHACWFSYTCYAIIEGDSEERKGVVDLRSADRVSYSDLLKKLSTVGCSTVMLDRDVVGDIQMPLIRTGQDYALWLSLLRQHGDAALKIPEILSIYRIRPNSISRNKLRKALRQWEIYTVIEGISPFRALPLMFHYIKNAVFRK